MRGAPLSWLLPPGFFAVTYPLSAMPLTQCPTLFGIVLLNVEVAASLGALIGAKDRDEATTVAIVYMVFVMCAGGYFINLDVAPKWVGYCRYVSFWYFDGVYLSHAADGDRPIGLRDKSHARKVLLLAVELGGPSGARCGGAHRLCAPTSRLRLLRAPQLEEARV